MRERRFPGSARRVILWGGGRDMIDRLRGSIERALRGQELNRMHIWLPALVGAVLLGGLSYAVLNMPWVVPIGLLVGIFGTLIFFIQPLPSLLAMMAVRILLDLLWWIPGSIGGLNVLQLFSGAATVLGGALFALEFRRNERHPCINAFILFSLVLAMSAVRNPSVRVSLELAVRYLSPPMMVFLTAAFFTRRLDTRRYMTMLIVICAIPLAVSLYHLATGQMSRLHVQGYNRLLGGYKSLRNHGMMMMMMAALATFWVYQARSQRAQVILLGYALASALCLYLSQIRTGLLALIGFVVTFLYISGRRRELVLITGLGIFITVISPEIQERFKDLVLVFTLQNDPFADARKLGSGRLGLWGDSFQAYLRQPLGDVLLGLGLGGHWELTQEAYNPFITVQDGQVDTHSDYLGLLYQLGPIALGSYLFMQVQIIRYGWRLARDRAADTFTRDLGALAAGLSVGVFVTNTISNGFVNRATIGWLFWSVSGIMFAAYARVQREEAEMREDSKAIPLRS